MQHTELMVLTLGGAELFFGISSLFLASVFGNGFWRINVEKISELENLDNEPG